MTTELQKELEEYKAKLRDKMMELSRANSSILSMQNTLVEQTSKVEEKPQESER